MRNIYGVRYRVLAFVALAVVVASCSRSKQVPISQLPAAPVDSVLTDSAVTDTVVPVVAKFDSAALDSIRRAQADSIAAAQAKAAAAARPKRPPRDCILDLSNNPPDSRAVVHTFPDSSRNIFIGGGFLGTCQGQNNTIRADSLEYYETAGVMNLYGNVLYIEPSKVQFTSMRANYFTRDERLYAEGNVNATQLLSGSTFFGPTMEYYRAVPGIREVSRMYAPGRPVVRLQDTDSAGNQLPPVLISANVIEDQGDSLIFAWGAVTIDRDVISGSSDSASYDKGGAQARLIRNATVTSKDSTRAFNLKGDTIQMFNQERSLERVVALHKALAVNGAVELSSENIDLRLKDQDLERAYAYGEGRSKAITPGQELEADSMAIILMLKRIREVRAIGQASAIGAPDSTKVKSVDNDMLHGDSVFARFDTTKAPEDTTQASIREIEAIGNARSLFHIASRKGKDCPPAVNYARGKTIVISFDSGAVRTVTIDSSASGVFLEPVQDSLDASNTKCGGSGRDTTRDTTADSTSIVVPPPPPPPPPSAPPVTPPAAPSPKPASEVHASGEVLLRLNKSRMSVKHSPRH